MQDGVKFIFRTLLKVPIIILVSFAVFNVFAFSLSYFKILGISYVAMQTAVENNYIPSEEGTTIAGYLANTVSTYMLENPRLTCTTATGTSISDGSRWLGMENRVQYGGEVNVRLTAHYRFVWPLQPKEQTTAGKRANVNAVAGQNGTGASFLNDRQLENARMEYENNPNNNIVIEYTVPGLKYYPDLS